MLTEHLIKLLQDLVDAHKSSGAEEVMGPHEVVIDVYTHTTDRIMYCGFSPFIGIDYSADGVYPILSWRDPNEDEIKAYQIKKSVLCTKPEEKIRIAQKI